MTNFNANATEKNVFPDLVAIVKSFNFIAEQDFLNENFKIYNARDVDFIIFRCDLKK